MLTARMPSVCQATGQHSYQKTQPPLPILLANSNGYRFNLLWVVSFETSKCTAHSGSFTPRRVCTLLLTSDLALPVVHCMFEDIQILGKPQCPLLLTRDPDLDFLWAGQFSLHRRCAPPLPANRRHPALQDATLTVPHSSPRFHS